MPDEPPADPQRVRAIRAANARLNEAMRAMFARWGEARITPPDQMAAAKEAVDRAEAEFQAARDAVEALEATASPPARKPRPEVSTLRGALERMSRALAQGNAKPDALFHEKRPELGAMHWQHEVASHDADVWVLADEKGRIVAKMTHGADEARWTAAVINEMTGELE